MFRRLPSISFVILLLSRVLINLTRLATLSGLALLMGIVSAISTMFKSTRREHEKQPAPCVGRRQVLNPGITALSQSISYYLQPSLLASVRSMLICSFYRHPLLTYYSVNQAIFEKNRDLFRFGDENDYDYEN